MAWSYRSSMGGISANVLYLEYTHFRLLLAICFLLFARDRDLALICLASIAAAASSKSLCTDIEKAVRMSCRLVE
jgi:hypothetical protein